MTTPPRQYTDMTLELQHQSVSTYHFNTAKQLANTALYMRLNHPHTYQTNDITTFDVTDETHRFRTFNDNWDRTSYDIKDFANEGFFSLHTTNLNIQCFSCGVIITKFPPYVSSFVIHLLASPDCKHLLLHDTTNKAIQYFTVCNRNFPITIQNPHIYSLPWKPDPCIQVSSK